MFRKKILNVGNHLGRIFARWKLNAGGWKLLLKPLVDNLSVP
jgi:hypothetical protein